MLGKHQCHINTNGRINCWGNNASGQLGLGDTTERGSSTSQMGPYLPYIEVGTGLVADGVSVGESHTCAHFKSNVIKCWGSGYGGRLGLGDQSSKGTNPNEMGDSLPTVNLGTGVTPGYVVCGMHFSCVYFTSGHNCVILANTQLMKCWGMNFSGQLGYGDNQNRGHDPGYMGDNLPTIDLGSIKTVKQVMVGGAFTCALRTDDELLCWGDNTFGQLGIGATGTVKIMGETMKPTPYMPLLKIKQLSGAENSICILYDDNESVQCIGYNEYGQLGQGDTKTRGDSPTTLFTTTLFTT